MRIKIKNLPRATRFGLWSFYKTTTCPKRPLLSGPKSGRLIQVWLYAVKKTKIINITDEEFYLDESDDDDDDDDNMSDESDEENNQD